MTFEFLLMAFTYEQFSQPIKQYDTVIECEIAARDAERFVKNDYRTSAPLDLSGLNFLIKHFNMSYESFSIGFEQKPDNLLKMLESIQTDITMQKIRNSAGLFVDGDNVEQMEKDLFNIDVVVRSLMKELNNYYNEEHNTEHFVKADNIQYRCIAIPK